jgi:hypothetical protein
MKDSFDISKAFDNYVRVISTIATDISFWKSFLTLSIKNYQDREAKPDEIYGSVFTAYDINVTTNSGHLATSNRTTSILTVDLEEHRILFFTWIMNLSLLKSYNALEIFLLQAIWLKYYPSLDNPTNNKKASDNLQKEIKDILNQRGLTVDTKNNRHLIEFLRTKSTDFETFAKLPLRADLKTSREDFFEMMSVLRNIIAHQGTIITQDTLNGIKSKSKDIFERHFTISIDENGDKHVNPIEVGITSILDLLTDFGVNTVKFVYSETDLKFIGMFSVLRPV